MKPILILIISCSIISSCDPATHKSKNAPVYNQNPTQKITGNKFFEYDAIDYYLTDFEETRINDLHDNQFKSKNDSFKMGVILGNIPKNISDLSFIDKLATIGYKKITLDKSKFEGIDKIFAEKTTTENLATACIYVYRDILIFKKDSKVIGTAKICFGCMANQIKGTNANTENFGQEGDYENLEKLLRQ